MSTLKLHNKDLELMVQVMEMEAKSILSSAHYLQHFGQETVVKLSKVLRELMEKNGSLIFCGVGKSGLIAQKCAATFTSLGLSSFFLHPVEALHGDLGRVKEQDAIVFISKSGTTEEILKLLPFIVIPKQRLISICGDINSSIAQSTDIVFNASVESEACLNNQAPTTSTTLAMAVGDAMAVLYEKLAGLSKEGFALNHPGGFLGKSMRMKAQDLMIDKNLCPIVSQHDTLKDVILHMTNKPLSAAAVIDRSTGKFIGIIVEGDIRRTLHKNDNGLTVSVNDIVNKNPIAIQPDSLALEGLILMEGEGRNLTILPVVSDNIFYGFLRLQELVKEGLKSH